MTSPAPAVTALYRVSSLNESGPDHVTVNFSEQVDAPEATRIYGTISKTFTLVEGADFFPGQVYTMTMTKNA